MHEYFPLSSETSSVTYCYSCAFHLSFINYIRQGFRMHLLGGIFMQQVDKVSTLWIKYSFV